ncbi:MAG: M4 family metallopeptidase, partial [Nannocystaceae bacterium]|nr:M4 family metallopeptidase [Nannocystaceae bacterium]
MMVSGSVGIRRGRVRIASLVGLLTVCGVSTVADASALADLQRDAPQMVSRTAAARGGLRFVHTRNGVRGIAGPADAGRFLERYGSAFGASGEVEARAGATTHDALGHTRVGFDAYYRGVRVYGAEWSLHFDPADRLVAVRAASVPAIGVVEVPSYGVVEAGVLAVDAVPEAESSGDVELFIFDRGLVTGEAADPRLAYRVVVEGPGKRLEVFIDAHGGELLLAASLIHEELNRRVYDSDNAPVDLVWQESDGPYLGGDSDVEDLIAYTQDAYVLYENVSGGSYLSYDGASAPMEGVVHYGTDCPNASWNGTSTNYCNGLVTDDVVAHEWAHAYTQANHRLIYAYQPGALNESYSDIFGEAVDLLNDSGDGPHTTRTDGNCAFGGSASERWLIGEEASALGGAIRDMWVPTCFNHPGRMSDGEYFCTGDDFFDNGGVHVNSGVPNHAFALLVDGGTTGGQTVSPIGMTKALAIYWRAMTVYQGVTSGFADHADAIVASCEDLVADGGDLPDLASGAASGEVMTCLLYT